DVYNQKKDFLDRQGFSINLQQADKDFNAAEFYRRTGHPGSAYFIYEIVRRRYPGTKYAERAADPMNQLRDRGQQSDSKDTPPMPAPGQGPRSLVPGAPVTSPEVGPTPRILPPSIMNDR